MLCVHNSLYVKTSVAEFVEYLHIYECKMNMDQNQNLMMMMMMQSDMHVSATHYAIFCMMIYVRFMHIHNTFQCIFITV